jgi:pimeloyl-ACP methyl ester carboxylesterase
MERIALRWLSILLLGFTACGSSYADEVLTVPVHFTVTNSNRSPIPCRADGLDYSISGQLTGPASQLGASHSAAATLYLHGLGFAGWYWNFDGAGADGYATALARQGHVSVAIDRLGHGASVLANGRATCLGAQADIAHQIVLQLKAGSYQRDDGVAAVAFDKIALGGHSAGGGVAEAEAYGFGDIDALLVMNWTDQGTSPRALLTLVASEG